MSHEDSLRHLCVLTRQTLYAIATQHKITEHGSASAVVGRMKLSGIYGAADQVTMILMSLGPHIDPETELAEAITYLKLDHTWDDQTQHVAEMIDDVLVMAE